jgi:hypothetical protein
MIVNPKAISVAVERQAAHLRETQSPWDAVEEVARTEVAPLVDRVAGVGAIATDRGEAAARGGPA